MVYPSAFRQPLVTGTSVLGLVYKDGVMLAADNLGESQWAMSREALTHIAITPASYGSLARFRDIERLYPLSETCLLGVAGDMSDFQALKKMLEALMWVMSAIPATNSQP